MWKRGNAVEIIVEMPMTVGSFSSGYYMIEPNENVKANMIYKNSYYDTRADRILYFSVSDNNGVSTSDLLSEFSESVYDTSTGYTYYRYYFSGSYETNNSTNQINSIHFVLIADKNNDGYWD